MAEKRRNTFDMVTVDGVRYRPEDAPKGETSKVQNKARTPEQTATPSGKSRKDA